MQVNIHNQWAKLSLWQIAMPGHPSIWEMLQREYGAEYIGDTQTGVGVWARFPDDKNYTAFLLKWS